MVMPPGLRLVRMVARLGVPFRRSRLLVIVPRRLFGGPVARLTCGAVAMSFELRVWDLAERPVSLDACPDPVPEYRVPSVIGAEGHDDDGRGEPRRKRHPEPQLPRLPCEETCRCENDAEPGSDEHERLMAVDDFV